MLVALSMLAVTSCRDMNTMLFVIVNMVLRPEARTPTIMWLIAGKVVSRPWLSYRAQDRKLTMIMCSNVK